MIRFIGVAIIVCLVLASASLPVTAVTDLWIWRDRWNEMDEMFRTGYVVGVSDIVEYVAFGKKGKGNESIASMIRAIHVGMGGDRFPSIQAARDWTNEQIAKSKDPLLGIAGQVAEALRGNDLVVDNTNSFVWTDRWMKFPESFQSGYVAGMFDIIRGLDNAGKSPRVLMLDVLRAALIEYRLAKKLHHGERGVSVGELMNAVMPLINKSDDPTESMAMVVFEALRR